MVFGGAVCTLVALWGMPELAATLGLALAYAIVTLAVWRGPALVCLVSVTHWVGTGYPRSVAWPLRLVLFARAAMAVSPRCAVPLRPCWVCGSGYPCALGPGGVGVFVCLALCGPALVSLALAALVGWPVLVSLVRWSVGVGSTTGSVPCVPCAGGLASVCHAVAALLGQSSCGYPCVLRPCGSGLAGPCVFLRRWCLGVPSTCEPCWSAGVGYPCGRLVRALPCARGLASVCHANYNPAGLFGIGYPCVFWPAAFRHHACLALCGPTSVCLPLRPMWSCWGWLPLCIGLLGPAGSVRVSSGPLWSSVWTVA